MSDMISTYDVPLNRRDAQSAWRMFLPKVIDYGARRNFLESGSVSRLSTAFRFRLLLEDEILSETLQEHQFADAEKWLQEVCWRRYWKGWLDRRPGVWSDWKHRVKMLSDSLSADQLARAEAVTHGRGGVGCMDTLALELRSTGYLHNHARMWWASYWIHVERLPWELGAEFFYHHLLDADPASNTLSWRWVAGMQTAGKTYLVRLSNLEKFAPRLLRDFPDGRERLDDSKVTAISPALPSLPEVCEAPKHPCFVHERSHPVGLWIHDEDLLPEIGPFAGLRPAAIISATADEGELSSCKRREAKLTALKDGHHRAEIHYGSKSEFYSSNNLASAIGTWAEQNHLQEVVAFAPFVGPNHDQLPAITRTLASSGITLTLIRRASDTQACELAKAGFFPFWEKMKRKLQTTF